jgi:hypothetical protein
VGKGDTTTEWTNIRVRKDAKEQAKERKPDGMSWSAFVASEEYDPTLSTDALINELRVAADEARVDTARLAREVIAQLDGDELSALVADELQTRLRD